MKPITRKEKIIAGEELTPITREEMFLSKYGGGGGSTVQSDLAQNDPAKPDYVKNRTHWAEEGVAVDLEEITISGFSENYDGIYQSWIGLSKLPFAPIIGNTYDVTWDGVTYTLVAKLHEAFNLVFLGDGNFYEHDISKVNGEIPFMLEFDGGEVLTSSNKETHTLSITHRGESVHKLDPKFLSDRLATFEIWFSSSLEECVNALTMHQILGANLRVDGLPAVYMNGSFRDGEVWFKQLGKDSECFVATLNEQGNLSFKYKEYGQAFLRSPSGKIYELLVDDDGNLSTKYSKWMK